MPFMFTLLRYNELSRKIGGQTHADVHIVSLYNDTISQHVYCILIFLGFTCRKTATLSERFAHEFHGQNCTIGKLGAKTSLTREKREEGGLASLTDARDCRTVFGCSILQ